LHTAGISYQEKVDIVELIQDKIIVDQSMKFPFSNDFERDIGKGLCPLPVFWIKRDRDPTVQFIRRICPEDSA